MSGKKLILENQTSKVWLSTGHPVVWGARSIEVFAPIYDLICKLMAQHRLAFAKHEDEWRIIICDEQSAEKNIQKSPVARIPLRDVSEN